jgi:tRNA(fMet)-specific endonuclease VapC
VKDHLEQAEEVFVPSIVLGELYFGARKSRWVKENLARIDEFALSTAVVGCDIDTAKEYGAIKDALWEKGKPIPENDVWIAAVARQHGLILVTRDTHFAEVDDLKVEIW